MPDNAKIINCSTRRCTRSNNTTAQLSGGCNLPRKDVTPEDDDDSFIYRMGVTSHLYTLLI